MPVTATAFRERMEELVPSLYWTTGKLDQTRENTGCVYMGLSPVAAIDRQGHGPHTYTQKSVRIVVRCVADFEQSDAFSRQVYQTIEENKKPFLGEFAYVVHDMEEPINLGTDNKGVYEHAINLTLYDER